MFIQQSRFKLKNVCNTILFKSLCDLGRRIQAASATV